MPSISSSEALHCSFCHKPAGEVAKLFSSPMPAISRIDDNAVSPEARSSDSFRSYICDECIAVCNSVCNMLFDSHTTPPPQSEARLSNEAIEQDVRERILKIEAKALKKLREKRTHPWLDHPLAAQLLTVTEEWIRCDRRGQHTDHQLAEMKRLAAMMLSS